MSSGSACIFSSSSKPVMSGSRRSSTTQSNGRFCSASSASRPSPPSRSRCRRSRAARRSRRRSISLSSTTSSRLLRGAVKSLMRSNAVSRPSVVERLDEVGECAVRKPVLPLLFQGDDLHRDVARGRVELELIEHRPTEHVGKEDVERDRGGPILPGERKAHRAFRRDDALEALVARQARAGCARSADRPR